MMRTMTDEDIQELIEVLESLCYHTSVSEYHKTMDKAMKLLDEYKLTGDN